VEHPHVYTFSGDLSNLLLSEKQLEEKLRSTKLIAVEIYIPWTRQIVGYPIIDLENFFTDIHKYLRFLEEAIILTLQNMALSRSDGETGVYRFRTPSEKKFVPWASVLRVGRTDLP
jgi:lipoyl(octanoyl) transferase